MATDILKNRSPEEVGAAYAQAFSDLKKALKIDAGVSNKKDEITLGFDIMTKGDLEDPTPEEIDRITGHVDFEYERGRNYEQIVVSVDDGATTRLSDFILRKDGLGNLIFASPSIFVGGNEIKLKGVQVGDPYFSSGGPQVDWPDDEVTARQLAGIELANWVARSVNEDKLAPKPEIFIKDTVPEKTGEPERDPNG